MGLEAYATTQPATSLAYQKTRGSRYESHRARTSSPECVGLTKIER
jgi:hypothetical protein